MKKVLLLSFFVAFVSVFAQKTHTVLAKENPYSIAKKYGMTTDELLKLNPKFKEGKLNIGDVLVINNKKNETVKPTVQPKPSSTVTGQKLGKIFLQPKQTIYGITKQYKISEAELRKLNPDLDNHLKIGDAVVLPEANIKKYADANAFNTQASVGTTDVSGEKVSAEEVAEGTYKVQPKDTYYGITKKFGISLKKLYALNPGLEEKGLQPGSIVVVKGEEPQKETKDTVLQEEKPKQEKPNTTVAAQEDYVTYTVQNGDTLFGISNKFNVSFEQLMTLNPSLSNGLKEGMVLKIKKVDIQYVKKSGDALSVVLMLPFGFDAGDSKYRGLATEFLAGAKLAIERNAKSGQKLEIKVIDAGSETSFKNSLSQINQNNTDLIVGPFFKSNVLEVLQFVDEQKIPIVAPFAHTSELYDYSNLIIIETDAKVYADRIAKEVKQVYSNQKIYLVSEKNSELADYLKKILEKELGNVNLVWVNSALDIQLDQNMMTGQNAPVIAILATENENLGVEFTKRISELAKEQKDMKAFSVNYHSVFDKNIDGLSQASMVYLMDRKINTDGDFEKQVLKDYKNKYCKSPSKYAVIGFDVMNDMLSRENGKGEIFKQINKVQTQLATKFEFVRAKRNGAYVNTGYRVVRLVP
ncbi:MAG: LysM peptidoglycan-binding domain-containing protein [Cloacibacterium sp.]|nr:LysM peptidoglycan-binding domain-containing protein [Cloacibacterium sp.]